jgi:hypothetical protein
MSEPSTDSNAVNPDRWVLVFLKFIGSIALLAFAAAVMPEKWIVEIAEELGFDPFPHSPLTFYLARQLSLLYGFTGAVMWLVALDLDRYRPLVYWMAIGTILLSVLQVITDMQSNMPTWWTLREPIATFIGGCLLLFLDRRATLSR